ncbi:hypothetical protein D1012_15310 [Pseudotabrizicola alkalilacus]|uniref:Uncharacterized protein n=1 Tax=Pseudotabrizicola alkalilacus TaxID=2305252 RepID=A0A411Z0F2_9RHOB|nr:hypothetical protein D1012_15310 [Pseudotabrizicola alkalilacus]
MMDCSVRRERLSGNRGYPPAVLARSWFGRVALQRIADGVLSVIIFEMFDQDAPPTINAADA